jgi:CheY-like chemotaxis protein
MSDRRRDSDSSHDRRWHFRAELGAGAVVHAAQIALKCRIVDVSLGGIRVHRSDDIAPCPALGTEVTVEFEIGAGGWVAQNGRVQRCTLEEIVITFGPLAAGIEDLIENEVLAAVEIARRPRMIVVDPSAERRRRVSDALRVAGCDSFEAATPLEAIDLIERPCSHFQGVAVSEHLTQTGANELCDFLTESNPHIQIALIAANENRAVPQLGSDGSAKNDRVSVLSLDDTLEVALRGFADAITALATRSR